jgi:dienelactone hydrolase
MYTMPFQKTVVLELDKLQLEGILSIPQPAKALVVFAHGSGSSRLSPRNKQVADYLHQQGIGSFLFDLLTPQEDRLYQNRFDIPLLSGRLMQATDWLEAQPECSGLRLGYFGASTGAAAALVAAAERNDIAAVVSRGGRPDLAMEALPVVKAPVLLIVGSLDGEVIRLNEQAMEHMTCIKKLEIVQGASHLFEEKGTMEKVCVMAERWFEMHLQPLEITNQS